MRNKEFIKIMTILAESFGADISEMTLAVWAKMFETDGITIDQIKEASRHIIRTRKYKGMPTYAEFYDFCKQDEKDIAMIQADEVLRKMRSIGMYGDPCFEDETTAYLMRTVWPWKNFCMVHLEKNNPFFFKDFIEKYKTYSKSEKIKRLGYENENIKQLASKIGG